MKKGRIRKGLSTSVSLITYQRDDTMNLDVTAFAYDLLTIDQENMTEEEINRVDEIARTLKKIKKSNPKIDKVFDGFIMFLTNEIYKKVEKKIKKGQKIEDIIKEDESINYSFIKEHLIRFSQA